MYSEGWGHRASVDESSDGLQADKNVCPCVRTTHCQLSTVDSRNFTSLHEHRVFCVVFAHNFVEPTCVGLRATDIVDSVVAGSLFRCHFLPKHIVVQVVTPLHSLAWGHSLPWFQGYMSTFLLCRAEPALHKHITFVDLCGMGLHTLC